MLANPFGVGLPSDNNVVAYSDIALLELIAFTSGEVHHFCGDEFRLRCRDQASGSGQAAMGQGMLWQTKRWMARALRGLCPGCPHSEVNLPRASALVEM